MTDALVRNLKIGDIVLITFNNYLNVGVVIKETLLSILVELENEDTRRITAPDHIIKIDLPLAEICIVNYFNNVKTIYHKQYTSALIRSLKTLLDRRILT